MNIKISEIKTQLEDMNFNLRKNIPQINNMIEKIHAFTENTYLEGEAYDGIKEMYETVRLPLLKLFYCTLTEMLEENGRYVKAMERYFDDMEEINEEYIIDLITALKGVLNDIDDNDFLYKLYEDAEADLYDYKRFLEKKTEDMYAFNEETGNMYSYVRELADKVYDGFICANSISFDKKSGTFCLEGHDLSWAEGAEEIWRKARYMDSDYFQIVGRQFGFDDKTVELMKKVYTELCSACPAKSKQEIDWIYARIMGGLVYDDNKEMWDSTAGDALSEIKLSSFTNENYIDNVFDGMSEEEIYTEILGLTKSEYNYLKYKVRVQHEISGYEREMDYDSIIKDKKSFKDNMEKALGKTISDDEFKSLWNEQYYMMKDKGDFAHQMITSAAILATDMDKNSVTSDLYFGIYHGTEINLMNVFSPVAFDIFQYGDRDELREDMSGWLGDAVLSDGAGGMALQPVLGSESIISISETLDSITDSIESVLDRTQENEKEYDSVSFGNGDYMSDLDAENITCMMKTYGLSYMEAAAKYYDGLGKDYTRAEYFLLYNDIDEIKRKIYAQYKGDRTSDYVGMEEIEAYLRNVSPEAYKFIECLEEGKNAM